MSRGHPPHQTPHGPLSLLDIDDEPLAKVIDPTPDNLNQPWILGTGLVRRLRDQSVELPQSPATVRAYREKGPADRRSQLLGVVDEHDIAKRGEPKRIFGFEEQDRSIG